MPSSFGLSRRTTRTWPTFTSRSLALPVSLTRRRTLERAWTSWLVQLSSSGFRRSLTCSFACQLDIWAPKPIILAGAYTAESGLAEAEKHPNACIAYGRYFISNVSWLDSLSSPFFALTPRYLA